METTKSTNIMKIVLIILAVVTILTGIISFMAGTQDNDNSSETKQSTHIQRGPSPF